MVNVIQLLIYIEKECLKNVIKMDGFLLSYKAKDARANTMLNHTLFGRLVYINRRGKKFSYYIPGILDNIQYAKIMNKKVFLKENIFDVNTEFGKKNKEILDLFGENSITKESREESQLLFQTGVEYWTHISNEKNLPIRRKCGVNLYGR